MIRSLCIATVLLCSATAHGDFMLTAVGVAVTEDFNDFRGTGFTPTPGSDQLDSDSWTTDGFGTDVTAGGTFTTGDPARGDDPGGVGTGGIYAFETTSGDFGLGIQPGGSDFTPGSITLQVINNTGQDLDGFSISYDTLVFNDQARSNTLDLSYSEDGGIFSLAPGSLVSSPGTADGSPSWVSTNFSDSFTFSSALANGSSFFLQWTGDDDTGSGSRDEFAIDNIVVTGNAATAVPEPSSLVLSVFAGSGLFFVRRRRRK